MRRGFLIFAYLLFVNAAAGFSFTEEPIASNATGREERCKLNKISTVTNIWNNLDFLQFYRCFPSYDSRTHFAMDLTATMELVWQLRNVLRPTEELHLELVLLDSACVAQVSEFISNERMKGLYHQFRYLVVVSTCGQTITRNNTYWVQPSYNSSYTTAGQCSVYVKKCAANICQLRWNLNNLKPNNSEPSQVLCSWMYRLDFVNFQIANPDETAGNTATQCLYDIFTVSGQSNNVPGICGYNTNQHSNRYERLINYWAIITSLTISVPWHDTGDGSIFIEHAVDRYKYVAYLEHSDCANPLRHNIHRYSNERNY